MLRKLLSPESIARLERREAEVIRMAALTNTWLAAAILRLARAVRAEEGIELDCPTYDTSLLWGIIPELARRIGVVKLEISEIDWTVRDLSDYELRIRIGTTLRNVSNRRNEGWELLTEEPINGNPVAIAIDRLVPGVLGDRDDWIACSLGDIAPRRGVAYAGVWTRQMLSVPALG